MPFQSTRALAAYVMGDALKEAVGWSPSLMGLVRFGGLRLELFRLILTCLDAYIKGAAMGYTFRDKYELLLSTMFKTDKIEKSALQLRDLTQKRLDSYDQEINSVIDFFISTELTKEKMSFDDFLERAKKKVKIDSAGPRIKLIFEEGTSFGANHPSIVTRAISVDHKSSALDWDKAKLMSLNFNIQTQEMDLTFLKRWARHTLGLFCREIFPELIDPMGL